MYSVFVFHSQKQCQFFYLQPFVQVKAAGNSKRSPESANEEHVTSKYTITTVIFIGF